MGKPSELLSTVPRLTLSRTEVAVSLGVSPNTVDQMVRDGLLPPPRRWHTRKLWITSEVATWLSEWPVDGEVATLAAEAADDEWRATT